MGHFSNDYLKFLKELSANNNREWFAENKARFKANVEATFHAFVEDLIGEMGKVEGEIDHVTSKECVFRIYKDVRFSKDKTPYKDHMAALISSKGRKGMDEPGLYLQSSAADVRMYGGAHRLEKNDLYAVRSTIAVDISGFRKLIEADSFVSNFGEIRGEKNKRLPSPFAELAEKEPLLFNKSFYFFKKWPAKEILKVDFIPTLIKTYLAGKPVSDFLQKARRANS